MIIRFKTQGSANFNGGESVVDLVAEYTISDDTSKEQFIYLDHTIDKLLDEYSNTHNGDFININYEDLIENAFRICNIEFEAFVPDKVIYL
jgi:hypothetical protein